MNQVLGTPYLWGGTTPIGFDCSGFILYVLKKFNVEDLPRTSQSVYVENTIDSGQDACCIIRRAIRLSCGRLGVSSSWLVEEQEVSD